MLGRGVRWLASPEGPLLADARSGPSKGAGQQPVLARQRQNWLAACSLVSLGLLPLAHAESPDRADPFGPQLSWRPIIDIRGRLEGQGAPMPDSRSVGQVARVGIEADRGILSARVSLQEVRAWTGDGDALTTSGSFAPEMAEAWTRLDGELSPNVGGRLTIGRQPLQIDDGRLVGTRDWDLQGQFLDAVRFELTAAPFSLEVVNARRFEPPTGEESTADDPFGLGLTVLRAGVGRAGPDLDGKLDLLSVADARNTAAVTTTTGFFGTLSTGRTLAKVEAYVQKNPHGDASFTSGEFAYVLGRRRAWVARVRYSTASGDPGTGDLAAFQPVLGDTHDQFGLLDLLQPADEPGGLTDFALIGELQAGARVLLKGQAHRLGSSLDGSAYAYETDLSMAWRITPYAAWELGVGQASGGTLGLTAGGYMQITVGM